MKDKNDNLTKHDLRGMKKYGISSRQTSITWSEPHTEERVHGSWTTSTTVLDRQIYSTIDERPHTKTAHAKHNCTDEARQNEIPSYRKAWKAWKAWCCETRAKVKIRYSEEMEGFWLEVSNEVARGRWSICMAQSIRRDGRNRVITRNTWVVGGRPVVKAEAEAESRSWTSSWSWS